MYYFHKNSNTIKLKKSFKKDEINQYEQVWEYILKSELQNNTNSIIFMSQEMSTTYTGTHTYDTVNT